MELCSPAVSRRPLSPGIIHEHTSPLGDVERIGNHAAKSGERGQVGRTGGLVLRCKQVGVYRVSDGAGGLHFAALTVCRNGFGRRHAADLQGVGIELAAV